MEHRQQRDYNHQMMDGGKQEGNVDASSLAGLSADGSAQSSSGNNDRGGGGGNGRRNLRVEQQKILNMNENRRITGARLAVFGFLLLSALAVSLAVFFYIRRMERQEFDDTFDAQAVRILELFHQSVAERLQAIDALSTMITLYALNTGSKFPNVTIPNFEMLGSNSRIISGGVFISFGLLVTDDQRAGWEEYARQNQNVHFPSLVADWTQRVAQDARLGYETDNSLLDGLRRNLIEHDASGRDEMAAAMRRRLQLPSDGNGDATSLQQLFANSAPGIYDLDGMNITTPKPGSGPYMPIWHTSPVMPLAGLWKQNLLTNPSLTASFNTILDTKEAVIAEVQDLEETSETLETSIDVYTYFLAVGQYRHENSTIVGDPVSSFHYPVFNNFTEAREVAGVLSTDIYWRLHFKATLNDELKCMVCVIENTYDQKFTFKLTSDEIIYLGSGDRHDSDFDDMMFEADMAEYLNSTKSAATQSYTSTDLNHAYSNYKIRVYPTSTMKDEYITPEPIIYTVAIIVVFLFTSSVFILYDCLVERRQRIVMDRAVKSGAVVSSLFPETVQDRLYNEQSTSHEKDEDPHNQSAARRHSRLLEHTAMTIMKRPHNDTLRLHHQNGSGDGSDHRLSTAPIADKFDKATIMFADLVQFTNWSSNRTPEEVFHLLETVYGNFDRLARRKHVFKVETIGDCYLAATGLPTPQLNHAIIMCQFAHACMKSLHATLEQLSGTLGADVMDLGLRIGIHSGEVTAGVLRGEKSRFQVFGDTVNTASRMESSCQTNMIQCTQTVADELILNGHVHWLKSREGLVNVKGKGKMQTYFLRVDDVFRRRSSSSSHDDDDEEEEKSESVQHSNSKTYSRSSTSSK